MEMKHNLKFGDKVSHIVDNQTLIYIKDIANLLVCIDRNGKTEYLSKEEISPVRESFCIGTL